MNKNRKDIVTLKKDVDTIDDKLTGLLVERKLLTDAILKLKDKHGITLKDPLRESEIIKRLTTLYGKHLDKESIIKVFNSIFNSNLLSHRQKAGKVELKAILEELKQKPIIIAGPCAIESAKQITQISTELSELGVRFLRGGAFKPRTSPDTFQGLGAKGLSYMRKAADKTGMFVVSEVLEARQLDEHYNKIDIIQIGSRNMASYGFLKQVGIKTSKDKKPVLLKRGFNATLNELLLAAKYITDEGNPNILLCLRGIRTFEQIDSDMRFTPDLASIVQLKEMTKLPVIFDPSHSTGNAKYVKAISKAALTLGADGLIIETHFAPMNAFSDGEQCILPGEISEILSMAAYL